MIGRPKALSSLLLLMLVAGLTMASSASAGQITTVKGEYPTVITGSQEGPITENYIETTPGRKVHCKTATGEAKLVAASTTVLVTPHVAECIATMGGGAELSMTFHLNGCRFEVTAGETTSPTQTHGDVNVICPVGKKLPSQPRPA
jgi:hypothetical protein